MSDRALYLARFYRVSYLESIYHVLEDNLTNECDEVTHLLREVAFTLSSTLPADRLFDGRPFVLVTAANPRSQSLEEVENRARNARLHLELKRRGIVSGASYGTDKEHTWREDGFVLWGVDPSLGLELGRTFEQNAIIYGEGDRVALGWCDAPNLSEALEWFLPQRVQPNLGEPAL